jgi:hypothetical protein
VIESYTDIWSISKDTGRQEERRGVLIYTLDPPKRPCPNFLANFPPSFMPMYPPPPLASPTVVAAPIEVVEGARSSHEEADQAD